MKPLTCSTSVLCGQTLETALPRIAEQGFKTIDLLTIGGWVHVNPSDMAADFDAVVRRVDTLLNATGLSIAATNTGVSPQLWDRSESANAQRSAETEALFKFMRHYGIPFAAIQPRNQDSSRPWTDVIDDCILSLREQFSLAEELGLQLGVELHVNSPFETVEQANYLLENMPEVALVYDPSHFMMKGWPIQDTTWILDRSVHVHLRDAGPEMLQAPFGSGAVDFAWVFEQLRSRGFQGGISIEFLENGEFDALANAKQLADWSAQWV